MEQALGNERESEKTAVFHYDRFLLKVKEVKMDIRVTLSLKPHSLSEDHDHTQI